MAITEFTGRYWFLSNFSPSPVEFEGIVFPTVENAFQSAKTLDLELRKQFIPLGPGQAKRLGRSIPLREDWEEVKVDMMYHLLQEKFKDPELRASLLATGEEELIEGNTWGDRFWGVCKGQGQNMLGRLLMRIRQEIPSDGEQ
jgi:ribA/ribD-fused uncharacterized protein